MSNSVFRVCRKGALQPSVIHSCSQIAVESEATVTLYWLSEYNLSLEDMYQRSNLNDCLTIYPFRLVE
jgi:hypothetical protein